MIKEVEAEKRLRVLFVPLLIHEEVGFVRGGLSTNERTRLHLMF